MFPQCLSTAVTLKLGQDHQNRTSFFMSQLFIHENLVRIQLLVHKILSRQENRMPTLMPMPICTKINVPLPLGGGHNEYLQYMFCVKLINK